MATPKGFEPLTFGFGDQRSAGLNYGAILWWRISDLNRSPPACKAGALPDELIPQISNTLFPMCVLKHSKLLRLPVRKECFNTLGFFYVQEHKPSPRPPVYFLECLWDRVSVCTKMKNPGVFSSGVLGRYTNIV